MMPVLFDLGGVSLHTYGAAGAAGFLLVAFLMLRDARAAGWSRDHVIDILFWGCLAGIAGARGLFLLQHPASWSGVGSLIDLRSGGLVFYGALTAVPVSYGIVRWRQLPVGPVLDAFGRALPLGHGVSRLGCFGAGCCYGAPWDGPFAVVFTDPLSVAPRGVPLFPVQLAEAAGLFALGGALSWMKARPHRPGSVFLAYLASYAVLRFATEGVRGDPERAFLFPALFGEALSTSRGVALGVLAAVAFVAWWRRRQGSA